MDSCDQKPSGKKIFHFQMSDDRLWGYIPINKDYSMKLYLMNPKHDYIAFGYALILPIIWPQYGGCGGKTEFDLYFKKNNISTNIPEIIGDVIFEINGKKYNVKPEKYPVIWDSKSRHCTQLISDFAKDAKKEQSVLCGNKTGINHYKLVLPVKCRCHR